MDTVKIKHLGDEDFTFFHGNVREEFKSGEVREVPVYVADELLRTERVERKWHKKDGGFSGEKRVALFERVTDEKADDGEKGKGEKE